MKKIAENICGFVIAGCGLCLWRYWNVPGVAAALLVLVGLGMVYDSFAEAK
jgi:hypothetical protein